MDEVFGLFPIPFMRAPAALPPKLVSSLVEHFTSLATRDNNSSSNLAHTQMRRPSDSPLLADAATLIAPKLSEFGLHLLGERLPLRERGGDIPAVPGVFCVLERGLAGKRGANIENCGAERAEQAGKHGWLAVRLTEQADMLP